MRWENMIFRRTLRLEGRWLIKLHSSMIIVVLLAHMTLIKAHLSG